MTQLGKGGGGHFRVPVLASSLIAGAGVKNVAC